MFAEFYAQNPLLVWPLLGLVIFVASFAAVLMYVAVSLREGSKVEYLAALPLEADAELAFANDDDHVAGEGSRDEH